MEIEELVRDTARAIKRIDDRRPQAANARTGVLYQPGIGPHPETQAVTLISRELALISPERYSNRIHLNIGYPASRQKCDLCIGSSPSWDWAIEFKMLRLMGDNGKPNDNMLMHILSPYPGDHSALTDCVKLVESGLPGRKGVLIYGFDYPKRSMDLAIEAFELLTAPKVRVLARASSFYGDLVHPVHLEGRVFGWEISRLEATGR